MYNRRTLLKTLAALAGSGVTGVTFFAQAAQRGAGGRGARGAAAEPTPGTTLILLGTQGGPGVSATRTQTSSVVLVDGVPYLMDCGYGAVKALVTAGLRVADVSNIFVSHLHNDHTADIAALLSLKWTGGQTNPQPVTVWGPPGSKAMVEGAVAFFKGDNDIRIVDEGRTVRAETLYKGRDVNAPKVTEVFKDDRVTVLAAENTHFPDRAKEKMSHRSFGWRFNTKDKSIVFSGDTAYSPGLVELAKGADIFVCEAMTMANKQQLSGNQRGANNTESIGRHVLETHSSTEDVGRMAAEAKVKTVVLYHQLGGAARGGTIDDAFIPDVKKFFSGPVIVGADQMKI